MALLSPAKHSGRPGCFYRVWVAVRFAVRHQLSIYPGRVIWIAGKSIDRFVMPSPAKERPSDITKSAYIHCHHGEGGQETSASCPFSLEYSVLAQ